MIATKILKHFVSPRLAFKLAFCLKVYQQCSSFFYQTAQFMKQHLFFSEFKIILFVLFIAQLLIVIRKVSLNGRLVIVFPLLTFTLFHISFIIQVIKTTVCWYRLRCFFHLRLKNFFVFALWFSRKRFWKFPKTYFQRKWLKIANQEEARRWYEFGRIRGL